MNQKLHRKLEDLPKSPGVYFHKDKSGGIIYIGKAANLRNRVRQYFQNSRLHDPKTDALVSEISDIDWTEVETELDALFLEAEMVRRYMPRYNILLRDDKSFVYVRIDIKSNYPSVSFTRRPLDDGAEYLGPYLSKFSVSRALKYLRRAFPYSTHPPTNIPKRACLQAQIGLCPGLEADMTSLSEYRKNLKRLMGYLRGKRKTIVGQLEKEMKAYARESDFENAAKTRDKLAALKSLERQTIFSDREAVDISKDRALVGLAKLLGLYEDEPGKTHSDEVQGDDKQRSKLDKRYGAPAAKKSTKQIAEITDRVSGSARKQDHKLRIPRRIEGFDISHMQGTDNVASMVVFVAGVPDKSQYRKFKMRTPGNDDFAHMQEVMSRRFSDSNIKKWSMPDLILIDGGKGQVSAALKILNSLSIDIPLIGLAKRFEEIIIPKNKINKANLQFDVINLGKSNDVVKLLQRIRDESHRFAVSYHSTLKRSRQNKSRLEGLAGIGPATRKKLIKHFGSVRAVDQADERDISKVVGSSKAKIIVQNR